MTTLDPRTGQNKTYPEVQLAEIGLTLNTTCPPHSRGRSLLCESSQWKLVSVQASELGQGDWLHPQLPWNPEIIELWLTIIKPVQNTW